MKTKHFFIAIIFLFSFSINGQEVAVNSSKKPASIYTFSAFSKDENNFSAINKKLKLDHFSFGFVDIIDLNLNQFSLDSKDIGKSSTTFMYDYKRHQDRNLLKDFLFKNDPTRWNLQCQQQNLQQ